MPVETDRGHVTSTSSGRGFAVELGSIAARAGPVCVVFACIIALVLMRREILRWTMKDILLCHEK